ncbi:MAG: hypothetical protein LUH04_19895 [Clostridium sp.]|nr:hypothetical protein [Clostridium sp.]
MIRAYIAEAGWQKDGSPQDQGGVRYLPQRMPQDGAIDWRRSALEIYNFIRTQTRPFPGAFSKFGPNEMQIWRTRPFALDRPAPSMPGQLAQIFTSGDILIGTGDGLLLVEDYSLSRPERLSEGLILESVDFSEQVKKIIRRHQSKHPNQPLQEALMPAEGFSDLKNLTPRGL